MPSVKIQGLSAALDPVAPGIYNCRVEEFSPETSKTGKSMWKIRLQITDDGPFQGRSLFDYIVVDDGDGGPSPVGTRRLAAFLRAVGVDIVDDEFDPADALQKHVLVRSDVEPGEQGPMERVRGYTEISRRGSWRA